jgi:hypothetical protein
VTFEVSVALMLKNEEFWVVKLINRLTDPKHFKGLYHLHLERLRSPGRIPDSSTLNDEGATLLQNSKNE